MREMLAALPAVMDTTQACRDRLRLLLQEPASGGAAAGRRKSGHRLSEAKRAEMRAILNAERFLERPPRRIWATLLLEALWVSWSTYLWTNGNGAVSTRPEKRRRCSDSK